jgi:nicotinamidase-related amidase
VLHGIPVLILIDLQRAVDHPSWGRRNNPDAEATIAAMLATWRKRRLPVIHVRHDSTDPESTYRPGQGGHEFKPEAHPLPEEPVVAKHTNNAFVGTHLEERLHALGECSLIVVGVSTNNSVEATVRMAGNLGFPTFLVEDACFTFERCDWSGTPRTAQEVHDMSLANLHGEYCQVVSAHWLAEAIGA